MNNLKEKFKTLKDFYDRDNFEEICKDELGIYFLKMCSLSRNVLLKELAKELNIKISNIENGKLFEFMFCQNIAGNILDEFIKKKYDEERQTRIGNEDFLYSQLYRLKVFDWGDFIKMRLNKLL